MSTDLFSLSGRVALVTGGNGGLGRVLALGLQAAGARVAVTGRDPDKNRAIARELNEPDSVFVLEVRDEAAVAATFAAVAARFGRLDILINNAGLYQGGGALALTRADWQAVLDAHLTGSFLCAQQAAKAMIAGGAGGKIVNLGSMYSLFGARAGPHYAAAKAGVLGLTRSLAVELAPHRIQVNAILPGWFETDLTRTTAHSPAGEFIRRKTPAGRWGEGADLAGAAVFLASPASDFITGAALPVDGGYSVADRFLAD